MNTSCSSAEIANKGHLSICKKLPLTDAKRRLNYPMPKGSLVMWLSRTLHGSAKSNTDQRRTGFFNSYLVDWLRQEENQFITVPPKIAEKLSDKAKKVVGYSASSSLGWVKGRDKDNLLIEGKSSPL